MKGVFFYPELLIPHMGERHGIELPDNLSDYNPELYPHWHVFRIMHEGVQMDIGSIGSNAYVIGGMNLDEIKQVTYEDLKLGGLKVE